MQLREVPCVRCGYLFVVNWNLWAIGTVPLHCPSCAHYFVPEDSPQTSTTRQAANASVPIDLWEPDIDGA